MFLLDVVLGKVLLFFRLHKRRVYKGTQCVCHKLFSSSKNKVSLKTVYTFVFVIAQHLKGPENEIWTV